ncbi:MAG: hypothetical protein M0Z93_03645 [Actinomycetota bacterium]|nr:hypothetical protein [Actinomycetota bacterium]
MPTRREVLILLGAVAAGAPGAEVTDSIVQGPAGARGRTGAEGATGPSGTRV